MIINQYIFGVPIADPVLISQTGYSASSLQDQWTVFSGLDLSDCDFAVVIGASVGSNRSWVKGSGTSSNWDQLRNSALAVPASLVASVSHVFVYTKKNPTSSETFIMNNIPTTGGDDGNTANFVAILLKYNNADTAAYIKTNGATTATTTGNPPALNLGSSFPAYWVSLLSTNITGTPSALPSGYSNGLTQATSFGTAASITVASKMDTVQSEDPGAFTHSSARAGVATLAIYNSLADKVAPVITNSSTVSYREGTNLSLDLTTQYESPNNLVWAATGGADVARASINYNSSSTSGSWKLNISGNPDYESPSDANGDNVFEIEVTATDLSGNASTLLLYITLTDNPSG